MVTGPKTPVNGPGGRCRRFGPSAGEDGGGGGGEGGGGEEEENGGETL